MQAPTAGTGSAPAGPALAGTEDEVLVQALRHLWPILDKASRKKAINIADGIRKKTE